MALNTTENNKDEIIESTVSSHVEDTDYIVINKDAPEPAFDPDEVTETHEIIDELIANIDGGVSNSFYNFNDVGSISDWAIDAMEWAYNNGIIKGRSKDKLAPNKPATREEVAVMLYRFCKNFLNK